MATTMSLGPFSTNAEGCTVADLLDPGRRRQPGPKREPVLADATFDNAR